MSVRSEKLTILFRIKRSFSVLLSAVTYISNKISNWRLNDLYMALFSFCVPWKHQEPSGFLSFREYRKWPVPWNELKILLTNMLAECWYLCLFHNRACFLIVNQCTQCTQEIQSFNVFLFRLILWHIHNNQLKQ